MNGKLALPIILFFVLLLPAASANHWVLYYEAGVDHVARTQEDDGAVVHAPGTPLDGRVNRVVHAGARPGDGTLFLDATIGQNIGYRSSVQATTVYTGMFTGLLLDRPDILLPGDHEISAWYGWWLDADDDHVIFDVHDAACGVSTCTTDEFVWRGRSTGEDAIAVISYNLEVYTDPQDLGHSALTDHTDSVDEQGWSGVTRLTTDDGFIESGHSFVLADAPVAVGSSLGYDIDHPGVLYDVDRHESLNADIESLYRSSQENAFALVDGVLSGQDADETVSTLYAGVIQMQTDARGAIERMLYPPDPKEPNTDGDDYGGHAVFGGVGDVIGSYNSYEGYVQDFHLWADALPWSSVCAGVYAPLPGTSTVVSNGACANVIANIAGTNEVDPVGAVQGTHPLHGMLYPRANVVLWKDVNRDGAVGRGCDPESDAFDVERNACTSAPRENHKFWGADSAPEFVEACATATGRGTTFTVSPIGGPWPGVIVIRDVKETTRVAFDGAWEVRTDAEPIELRWGNACESFNPVNFRSRDAIMFPTAYNTVAIRMVSTFSIDPYTDLERGVEVGFERVVDVDLIPAIL